MFRIPSQGDKRLPLVHITDTSILNSENRSANFGMLNSGQETYQYTRKVDKNIYKSMFVSLKYPLKEISGYRLST